MALLSPGINMNAGSINVGDAAANYGQLTQAALDAQYQTMLKQAGLESQLLPVLTKNFTDKYSSMMDATLGLQNKYLQPSLDIQKKFADGATGIFNGTYNGVYGNMSGPANQSWAVAKGAYDRIGGQLDYQDAEVSRTKGGLDGNLSDSDIRHAQQVGRAAAQARGLQYSTQGPNLEVLNTYNLQQQRKAAAQNAYVQQQAAQAQMYGLSNQAMGNINNAESNRNQIANIAAQSASNIFNRSSIFDLAGQIGMATNGMAGLVPGLLQPESQGVWDMWNQLNQNANTNNARNSINGVGGGGRVTIGGKSTPNNAKNQYVNGNPALGLLGAQGSMFGKPVQQLYGPGGARAGQYVDQTALLNQRAMNMLGVQSPYQDAVYDSVGGFGGGNWGGNNTPVNFGGYGDNNSYGSYSSSWNDDWSSWGEDYSTDTTDTYSSSWDDDWSSWGDE